MNTSIENSVKCLSDDCEAIIFFDTCVLLHIANSIHRINLNNTYIDDFITLANLVDSKIKFVTYEIVHAEWSERIEEIIEIAQKEVRNYDNLSVSIVSAFNSLQEIKIAAPPNIGQFDLPNHARNFSESILDLCEIINSEKKYDSLVLDRIRMLHAPAQKGKNEPKDCEIVECFLDLCRQARESGFEGKIIFMTDNKHDFGTFNKLKPPLDIQFEKLDAQLIATPDHVISFLGF